MDIASFMGRLKNEKVAVILIIGFLAISLGSNVLEPGRTQNPDTQGITGTTITSVSTSTTTPTKTATDPTKSISKSANGGTANGTYSHSSISVTVTKEARTGSITNTSGATSSETTGGTENGAFHIPGYLPELLFAVLILGSVAYFIGDDTFGNSDGERPIGDRDDAENDDDGDEEDDDEPNQREFVAQKSDEDSAPGHSVSGSSFENDVVRAWSTFVDRIEGVKADTATPGEIQRAAIDAGDPPDAVRTLTETFNDVRYGAVDPERHRAAASAALRTIAEQDAAAAEGANGNQETPKGGTGDDEAADQDRNEEKKEEDDHR